MVLEKAFFTYCWVIVDPPWVAPPRRLLTAARSTPVTEIPPLVRNVRSSADSTAFCTVGGILSSGTNTRFCAAKRPISVLPSA